MPNKIYAEGIFLKVINTQYGGMLTININVDKFISFLQANKNEKGYVNLNIKKRKEKGRYGDTHYAEVNPWKPKQETMNLNQEENLDDVPFD